MALGARKVFGAFEKQAPGKEVSLNSGKKQVCNHLSFVYSLSRNNIRESSFFDIL